MAEKPTYERAKGESSQAFEAWRLYRDMGVERSVSKVASKCQKNPSLLNRWSQKWHWQERLAEWEAHLDQVGRQQIEQQRRDMVERHIKIASGMQGIGVAKLTEWQRQIAIWSQDPSQPLPEISPSDISKLIEIGVKIERLSRGEPTEQIDSRVIEYKFIKPRTRVKKVKDITDSDVTFVDKVLSDVNNE
jgi:hypothetical protein